MYKPQYLNREVNSIAVYGANTAYWIRKDRERKGFKWKAPEKKINKSDRRLNFK